MERPWSHFKKKVDLRLETGNEQQSPMLKTDVLSLLDVFILMLPSLLPQPLVGFVTPK